jgi:hypothetical protein
MSLLAALSHPVSHKGHSMDGCSSNFSHTLWYLEVTAVWEQQSESIELPSASHAVAYPGGIRPTSNSPALAYMWLILLAVPLMCNASISAGAHTHLLTARVPYSRRKMCSMILRIWLCLRRGAQRRRPWGSAATLVLRKTQPFVKKNRQ